MNKKEATVGSSLLEAIEEYALKIEKIRKHDPENSAELACLYSGISGINECVTALRANGFITEHENSELDTEMHRLYVLCRTGC
jgi:hypothetical protein